MKKRSKSWNHWLNFRVNCASRSYAKKSLFLLFFVLRLSMTLEHFGLGSCCQPQKYCPKIQQPKNTLQAEK